MLYDTNIKAYLNARNGSVALMFGVSTTLLAVAMAIAINFSLWISQRTTLQDSLDNAVLGATTKLARTNISDGELKILVESHLSASGVEDTDVGTLNLIIDRTNYQIAGTISTDKEFWIMPDTLNDNPVITVGATAIAGTGGPYCVLALAPTASHALEVSGSGHIEAPACNVQVNSASSSAVTVTGSATINAENNYVVGGIQTGASQITPAMIENSRPVNDPFAHKLLPAIGSCDYTDIVISGVSVTLDPGVYCGGLKLAGAQITLNPGVYVIKDGSLELSGSSRIDGNGVAFRLSGTDAFVNSSATSQMHLVAPQTGDFAGFVFFQEHDADAGGKSTISGSGELYFEGVVYFPTQDLEISGSSTNISDSPYTAIVANTFEYSGTTALILNADETTATVPILSQMRIRTTAYLSR